MSILWDCFSDGLDRVHRAERDNLLHVVRLSDLIAIPYSLFRVPPKSDSFDPRYSNSGGHHMASFTVITVVSRCNGLLFFFQFQNFSLE